MARTLLRPAFALAFAVVLGCATPRVDWTRSAVPKGAKVTVVVVDAKGQPADAETGGIEQALLDTGVTVVDRSLAGSADYLLWCRMPRNGVCDFRLVRCRGDEVVGAGRGWLEPAPLRSILHDLVQGDGAN